MYVCVCVCGLHAFQCEIVQTEFRTHTHIYTHTHTHTHTHTGAFDEEGEECRLEHMDIFHDYVKIMGVCGARVCPYVCV